MRHTAIFTVLLAALALCWAGCNKTKTYAEKLKDEKKAIDRYISSNELEILNKMPDDTIFKPNQYFKTPEGLYLNVINKQYNVDPLYNDSIRPGDEVNVRVKKRHFFMQYSEPMFYNWNENPVTFRYTPGKSEGGDTPLAWDIALQYVNNYALVKMIVPSVMGDKNDLPNVIPVQYDSLWYKRSLK